MDVRFVLFLLRGLARRESGGEWGALCGNAAQRGGCARD